MDLSASVDPSVEGRKTLKEVTAGVGHIIRDVISHNKQVMEFVISDLCEKHCLKLECAKAKETKAAKEKKKENNVDESKYTCVFPPNFVHYFWGL